jgi:hypothetical protein
LEKPTPSSGFLKKLLGLGQPELYPPEPESCKVLMMPTCIAACEGEIPVKQYSVAELRSRGKFEKAQGRILVTNKRVLFRAFGGSAIGSAILQQEYPIEEIAGIEARLNRRLSMARFMSGVLLLFASFSAACPINLFLYRSSPLFSAIFSLLSGCLGIAPFFLWKSRFRRKLAAAGLSFGFLASIAFFAASPVFAVFAATSAAIALCCLYLHSLAPDLAIGVMMKGDSRKAGIRRRKQSGLLSFLFGSCAFGEHSGFSEVAPSAGALNSIHELGAVIRDIQEMGEAGVLKWKRVEDGLVRGCYACEEGTS